MMESARMAGPVFFQRYTGQFHGVKVQVEVWELPDKGDGPVRYITELSFKEDNFGSAAEGREKMKESLTELGILVPEDALKTRQILDAYFEAS